MSTLKNGWENTILLRICIYKYIYVSIRCCIYKRDAFKMENNFILECNSFQFNKWKKLQWVPIIYILCIYFVVYIYGSSSILYGTELSKEEKYI